LHCARDVLGEKYNTRKESRNATLKKGLKALIGGVRCPEITLLFECANRLSKRLMKG
jgi:hypothetical protein